MSVAERVAQERGEAEGERDDCGVALSEGTRGVHARERAVTFDGHEHQLRTRALDRSCAVHAAASAHLAALAAQGRDIIWNEDRSQGYVRFQNKIWQAFRFL